MPFGKIPNTRYKKKSNKKNISNAVKTYVKKAIVEEVEHKRTELQVDNGTMTANYGQTGDDLMVNMTRGTTEGLTVGSGIVTQGMLGLQVRLQSLQIWGTLFGNSLSSSYCRLVIVMDNQAASSTLLSLYGGSYVNSVFQTNHVSSCLVGLPTRRFTLLFDRSYILNSGASIKDIKININLRNQVMQYYPTTASFYELTKRIRFFYFAVNNSTNAIAQPTIQYMSRVVFTDA